MGPFTSLSLSVSSRGSMALRKWIKCLTHYRTKTTGKGPYQSIDISFPHVSSSLFSEAYEFQGILQTFDKESSSNILLFPPSYTNDLVPVTVILLTSVRYVVNCIKVLTLGWIKTLSLFFQLRVFTSLLTCRHGDFTRCEVATFLHKAAAWGLLVKSSIREEGGQRANRHHE